MTDLPWHEYSAGESAADLFALANSHRADSLVVAFETALSEKAATLGAAALSQPELDVLAIEALEREVNNGGYGQFFLNSSNEYAGQIVDALKRIGCSTTAAITARALTVIPGELTASPESLAAFIEEHDPDRNERLEECHQAFCQSGEDIATALLRHLLRHRDAVRLPA
jgi:hypothetical protein